MIEVENLTKRYGDKVAVDGLTFTVEPGVVTGFLGPNGAGKPVTGLCDHSLPAGSDRRAPGDGARQASRYTAGTCEDHDRSREVYDLTPGSPPLTDPAAEAWIRPAWPGASCACAPQRPGPQRCLVGRAG
jgi:hypothetical protein